MTKEWQLNEGSVTHLPCHSTAFIKKKQLRCSKCNKKIPAELELPAQVFNAYIHESYFHSLGDILLNMYTNTNIEELSDLTAPIYDKLKE